MMFGRAAKRATAARAERAGGQTVTRRRSGASFYLVQ
jgi:hypothetical protein